MLRRAVELQDQFISGNAGLQMVGANARLGYVYYLQGRYDDAIREYERGMAFLQTSDHALKERSLIELDVKLGAAYQRAGRMESAKQHFDRALKTFEARVAKGADDPFTRYYIADLHALRGDRRSRLRLARARLRRPARTHGRAHPPRPRPRVAERRSAFRPFRGGSHRARRGVNTAGARDRGSGIRDPENLGISLEALIPPDSFSRGQLCGFPRTSDSPGTDPGSPTTDPVCVSSIGPVLFVPQDRYFGPD